MADDLDFTVGKLSPAGDEREQEIKGIKALCSARSYMGKDIGEIFSYRDLWANLIIDPYIELSPELVWVARGTQDGEILGYLTGAAREDFYRLQEETVDRDVDALRNRGLLNMVSHPMLFWGNAVSIIGGLNHRTIEFLKYLKFKAREEVPRRPESPHFNVFCRHDGQGIARALIDAYLDELRRLGIARYHITALYVPGDRLRLELQENGFRVRSLDFFLRAHTLYDTVETTIFHPYDVMIGCFEADVPSPREPMDASPASGGKT
jgi:GNAT superfamily N-acetyltransferase